MINSFSSFQLFVVLRDNYNFGNDVALFLMDIESVDGDCH